MKLETLTLPPMGENCYILHDDKECVIFDPGSYFSIIRKFLDDNNLKVKYIMNTHAHFDHVGAVTELKEHTGAPFFIHNGESEILAKTASDPLRFGLPTFVAPEVDKFISDNDVVEFGASRIKAIHTPGHTPGGTCFLITPENILISGDTLFFESVGRTDFPYSSSRDIVVAIKEKLYTLDPTVKVYPGHGTSTMIGHERDNNPFVRV